MRSWSWRWFLTGICALAIVPSSCSSDVSPHADGAFTRRTSSSPAAFSVVFRFPSTGTAKYPFGKLLLDHGALFGVSRRYNSGDALYAIYPNGSNFTIIHTFQMQSDGLDANGDIISYGNGIYGTTENGGAKGFGALFEFDLTSGTERVVHSFGSGSDGKIPSGGLLAYDGWLYGVTARGGTNHQGTLYRINPKNRKEEVLHNFLGGLGGGPTGTPIVVNGQIFGGGIYNSQQVFFYRIGSTGLNFAVNYFTADHDRADLSSLTLFNGKIYGEISGGRRSNGQILTIDPTSLASTAFDLPVGAAHPFGGLSVFGGQLYGMSQNGGYHQNGSVFAISPAGSVTVVHRFGLASGAFATDGSKPNAELRTNGTTLWGTTNLGGNQSTNCGRNPPPCGPGNGTIFSITPAP